LAVNLFSRIQNFLLNKSKSLEKFCMSVDFIAVYKAFVSAAQLDIFIYSLVCFAF